jgi:hypothetical protein
MSSTFQLRCLRLPAVGSFSAVLGDERKEAELLHRSDHGDFWEK